MATEIQLRSPSSHTYLAKQSGGGVSVKSPNYEFLSGTWNVSYSSLPLWKGKQNVKISYKYDGPPSKDSESGKMPDLDDHVEYQKEGKDKVSHIHGVSRPVDVKGIDHGLAYSWRGKGMLTLITSNWEILGYGTDTDAGEPNDWVVTFFCKTLFTPAGIDIYTRRSASLSETALTAVKASLEKLGDGAFTTIVKSMFEVPRT
jgi:hypothetical protein